MKILAIGMLILALTATHAQGQMIRACGDRGKMTEMLQGKYKEKLVAVGIQGGGKQLIEIYTSAKGGFTVLLSGVNKRACIVAAGKGWQILKPNFDKKT